MAGRNLPILGVRVSHTYAAFFASLAAFLFVSGCGRQTAPPDHARPESNRSDRDQLEHATESGHAQADGPHVPPLMLEGHQSIADLDRDAWETEKFSRDTDAQLKKIAEQLPASVSEFGSQWADVVAQDFTGRAPASDGMNEAFYSGVLSVTRSGNDDKSLQLNSAKQLASWLQSIAIAASTRQETHLKFKTFGVDVTQDQARTTVWMRLDTRFDDQRVQCSAIWKCRWQLSTDSALPQLKELVVEDFERVVLASNKPLFTDCTESILGGNESYHEQLVYGLDYWLNRLELYDGIIATSYHGLAVGDVNNDGLDDVYLFQPGGAVGGLPNRLFVQQSDGTAVDMSADSGIDWLLETHSALFVDLNNDGHQDIVAATVAGLIFAENDGQGHFQPKLHKLTPEAPAISIAAADFDNDGDVDVYACSYGRRAASDIMGRPVPYHDANNGARNVLFRNDRDWRFTNVTKQVGLESNNTRFSLACAWEDYDNDGDQDLYVANDFGRNSLYQNNGGQFVDVAANANVEDMSAGMSVAWGDYDNDGRMDLYVSNMWSSAGNRIAYQRQFLTPDAEDATLAGFQRHARGNSLFRNVSRTGVSEFTDTSVTSHTTMGGWAWSSRFVDINNDGWEDLVVANGYITQDDPHDL